MLRLIALLSLATPPQSNAAEPAALPKGVEPPVSLEQFQELLSNSPFRRLMSLSDDLILTGVARLPAGTVVTILNRRTNETYSVSGEENAQGWKLVELAGGSELEDVQATIMVGKQEVTLRFDPRRLKPENIRQDRRSAKPGRKPEDPSVEEWLAKLNPQLLGSYDELAEPHKLRFKSVFREYVDQYPNASSELREEFARENIDEMRIRQEAEARELPNAVEQLDPDES